MNISELRNQLEEISTPFRRQTNYYEALGFNPFIEVLDHRELLRRGWWHTLWIGHSPDGGFFLGLRIFPDKSWREWPVVLIKDFRRAITHADCLSSAPALFVFREINGSQKIFKSFQTNKLILREMALPFYRLLDQEQKLNLLIDYLSDDRNMPGSRTSEFNGSTQRFVDFTSKLFESQSWEVYLNIITQMIHDQNILPEWPEQEIGAWKTRLANIIAGRALIQSDKLQISELEPIVWRSFLQQHGYDANDSNIYFYPKNSYEPYMGVRETTNFLNTSYYSFDESITQHPLYAVAEAIHQRGVHQYSGIEHLEAAAILDEQFHNSYLAWISLSSAAYWAGKNQPDIMTPIFDAAIFMCREKGWIDALEALSFQQDVYEQIT